MALAAALVIPGQVVVAEFFWQRFLLRQQLDDLLKQPCVVSTLYYTLVIPLERGLVLNRQYSGPPSSP